MCSYEKGEEVRFLGSKHCGKIGWLNDGKKTKSKKFVNVIIMEPNGDLIATRLAPFNVRKRHKQPSNREEAMIQEDPDLENEIAAWCRKVAKYQISVTAVTQIVEEELVEAGNYQLKIGNKKGFWKKLDYDEAKAKDETRRMDC